ncbi:MAG: class I poly(R)-hydroxyalkanoic acid synthase [Rhodospirillales bacterium]|nr:class I poly(R)-hydroxyalkanoic acid synthase [Rhodospirillales bacterium]
MNDESKSDDTADQQARMVEAFQTVSERSQRIAKAFMDRQATSNGFQVADPIVIGKAFMEMTAKMLEDPQKLAEAQAALWQQYADLWSVTAKKMAGEDASPEPAPAAGPSGDKRFKDDAWTEDAVYDFIKQSYLLTSDWVYNTVRDVDGLDPKTREKVDFYTRQYVDALSPTNFAPTNPKVMRATIDSKGENLVKGFENLLRDLENGEGQLRISMTDTDAFTLGENVAVSPGKVIFQNDLMQLIQYAPSTDKVARRPLLIVPPWINKFYVLDLQPRNSLIKWAVDQGHTVFVVSWINPDETLSHKTFDDYMLEGPLAALDAIGQATGEREVNLAGYCIGGTLVACMLSYMAAKGDDRVASATFLTTMTDFAEPGELGVFIDEEQLDKLEEHMNEVGFLEGRHMSQVFNMMRDNDLIWSFVVNNYLLGRDPIAFDLLYWNSDNTRMPAMMHGFYLREMYLNNKLKEPGALSLAGVPMDLTKIKVPIYMLSTADDHIAPWKSTYAATQFYSGPKKFVLSASGHIAGVVNPPVANKYCYWTNRALPTDPDDWLKAAKQHEGSWWTDWQKWVKRHAGGAASARTPGDGKLKPLEDAPGSYVKARHM